MADELGLIPSDINVQIAADTSAARTSASELIAHLNNLRATVGVSADTSAAQMAINALRNQPRMTLGVGAATMQADGGLWDGPRKSFANGGVNALGQMVPRVPQIAKGGANILWGEPETGWEAYISGKPSELARNREIHAEAGRRLGVETVPLSARYAAGHITGSAMSTPNATSGGATSPEAIRAALSGMAFVMDGEYVRLVARGEANGAVSGLMSDYQSERTAAARGGRRY